MDPHRPVTYFRPFRNADSPALTALWNKGAPGSCAVRPLTVREFDERVVGTLNFDASGLIVAESNGRPVGYVHAGFGPNDPILDPPFWLSHSLGSVGMLVVEPELIDTTLEQGLIQAAEKYLRENGAEVVYAGGQFPLNPFYWGIYGGSECAGVLGSHIAFHRAASQAGYEPVSSTVLFEADLTGASEFRDPRGVLIRRMTRLDVAEDDMPKTWWESVAIGDFRPTHHRLVSKADETELAHATTWDMSRFGRQDGRSRIGLFDVEVHADHRRKGYGRHLVNEILRLARAHSTAMVAVQTRSTNTAALALYQSIGFEPVETATLYRHPGGRTSRSASTPF